VSGSLGDLVKRLLADPARAAQVGRLVGVAQRGKRTLETAQAHALHALGFAHRGDYQALDRSLSATRRRAKRLLERVSKLEAATSEEKG
jgi:hypothetical protein